MHLSQKRIFPRTKDWLPLVTQQFRLRNIYQVMGVNIGNKNSTLGYYYTMHATVMSAPFYTSETLMSDCPKWNEIDTSIWESQYAISMNKALVFRLWSKTENDAEVVAMWGINLNGLNYIGQQLTRDLPAFPNPSLIFILPGGYFTDYQFSSEAAGLSHAFVTSSDNIRRSYTTKTLFELQKLQRKTQENNEVVENLRMKISSGQFDFPETRGGRRMLHRLLLKNKQRHSVEDVSKAWENVEIAKFRVAILKHEKQLVTQRLRDLNTQIEQLADRNQCQESITIELYRLLRREVQTYRDWWRHQVEKRENQLHRKAILHLRIKQLISELRFIYPIEKDDSNKYTICGVHLPDAENYSGHDQLKLAVALGFVAHTVQMISTFLQVPLRYPVIHFGSRSRVTDEIAEDISDNDRQFPLFFRGRDRPYNFDCAVFLLNKNIAQLRTLCGLPTKDLRETLSNLYGLFNLHDDSQMPILSPASSAMDFSAWDLPKMPDENPSKMDVLPPWETPKSLSASFSYSLDKGLNELEEFKHKTDLKIKSRPNCRNSESSLLLNPEHSPVRLSQNLLVPATNPPITSDEDSEICSGALDDERPRAQSCTTYLPSLVVEEEIINVEEEKPQGGFDSVTNRTEVLMNETGSFNMFRTRFSSILGQNHE